MNDKEKRILVFNKFNGRCAYCGCMIEFDKFHVDHIEPKYRGYTNDQLIKYNMKVKKGSDKIENLFPSCASCNSSKSTFTVEKWRIELELKKQRIKRDSSTYNILLRYVCIIETNNPILFYFEKCKL